MTLRPARQGSVSSKIGGFEEADKMCPLEPYMQVSSEDLVPVREEKSPIGQTVSTLHAREFP